MCLMLFAPVILELAEFWMKDSDYSHGFFVIPVSIYMVWTRRTLIQDLFLKPEWSGLFMLIAASASYIVSVEIKFHTMTYLSMLLFIFSLLLFIAGWPITKKLLAPLLFLFFMFPIPSTYYLVLTHSLKLFVTDLSVLIIRLFEIPIYKEGNLIYMPELQLEVDEACSGLRSLYSYMMLSCIFAWFSDGFIRRLVLIVSAAVLAIGINVFRVSFTGILSSLYGVKVAQGFFHEFVGIIMFSIGFLLLFSEYCLIGSLSWKRKQLNN